MNRRNLLKLAALSPFLTKTIYSQPSSSLNVVVIKPEKLEKGDKVAIVAPATNVTDPMDIYRAKEICKALELTPVFSNGDSSKNSGYKTRSAEERVDEFHTAFADNSIKAVFAIRGGYGSGTIIDKIDYNLVKNNPKVFAGYSDITTLLISVFQRTGLVTFHSPVMLSSFYGPSYDSFKNAMFSDAIIGQITNPDSNDIRNSYPILTINSGSATGQLVGGNLSLLTSMMGTEYEINTDNKILFIEDVGEAPYSIDRMLNQLRLAGKFDNVRGIVIGRCDDCNTGGENTWDSSELEVFEYYLSDLNIPVIYGLLIGHTSIQYTLPIGVNCNLNADEKYLEITESAVV